MRVSASAIASLVAVALVAGCGDEPPPDGESAGDPTSPPPSAGSPSSSPEETPTATATPTAGRHLTVADLPSLTGPGARAEWRRTGEAPGAVGVGTRCGPSADDVSGTWTGWTFSVYFSHDGDEDPYSPDVHDYVYQFPTENRAQQVFDTLRERAETCEPERRRGYWNESRVMPAGVSGFAIGYFQSPAKRIRGVLAGADVVNRIADRIWWTVYSTGEQRTHTMKFLAALGEAHEDG